MEILGSEHKLTKLILQIEFPSYHLTLKRKSAPVQNPSTLIPKAFNQQGIAKQIKNYFGINVLMWPIL